MFENKEMLRVTILLLRDEKRPYIENIKKLLRSIIRTIAKIKKNKLQKREQL